MKTLNLFDCGQYPANDQYRSFAPGDHNLSDDYMQVVEYALIEDDAFVSYYERVCEVCDYPLCLCDCACEAEQMEFSL